MAKSRYLGPNPQPNFNKGARQLRWEEHQPLACWTGDNWVRGSITNDISFKPPRRHALYGTVGRLPRLNYRILALNSNQILKRAPDSSGEKSTSLSSAVREITGSVVRLPPALVLNPPADMRFMGREVGFHGYIEVPWP